MAKYEIRHSCGHVESVDICGTNVNGERERRASWLASRPCRECILADRVARNGKDGMPILVGSPRQVAWALDIRAEMLGKIDELATRFPGREGMQDTASEVYGRMREDIISHEDAAWFIEHRIYDVRGEFSRFAKEVLAGC